MWVCAHVFTLGWCRSAPCTWPLLRRIWSSGTTATRWTTGRGPLSGHAPRIWRTDPCDTTGEKEKERNEMKEKKTHRNSFLIRAWALARASSLSFLAWTNAQHHTWTLRHLSCSQGTTPGPVQAKPTNTHHHLSPLLISYFDMCLAVLCPAGESCFSCLLSFISYFRSREYFNQKDDCGLSYRSSNKFIAFASMSYYIFLHTELITAMWEYHAATTTKSDRW